MTETILYQVKDRVAHLVLNRPEKLNAWSAVMQQDVSDALDTAAADPEVRAVILKGAGRAFCAGADWGSGTALERPRDAADTQRAATALVDFYVKLWALPKPTIAQVHGHCIGVATQIAICCDITMVSEDCSVGWPTIPTGGASISPMWFWLVGPKRAKEGSFALRQLTGSEAAEWGWANRAVPASRLAAETEQLAREIARIPSEILRIKKQALNQIMDMLGFRTAMGFGAQFNSILHHSRDVAAMEAQIADGGWRQFKEAFQSHGFDSGNQASQK